MHIFIKKTQRNLYCEGGEAKTIFTFKQFINDYRNLIYNIS